jgi:hypothetical protein
MVFGMSITPLVMVVLGIALFVLLMFQVAVGMRWINLGRKRLTYHKYVAWTLVGVAAVHGLLGILFAYGLRLF